MSEQVVGAPVEFAAWAEFVGRVIGSRRYLRAGPFVVRSSIFSVTISTVKQKYMKKRRLREGNKVFLPLACTVSYLSCQSASQVLPL